MANREEILNQIIQAKAAGQDTIRRKYIAELQQHSNRDTVVYASAFTSKKLPQLPPLLVSITVEDIQGFMAALHGLSGESLDLVLHSPGGSLEATDQLVQYLRAKYKHIRAIIPQNAMSAATMLACACDEIVMGKHSAIGPIDPQITFPTATGHFTAPAHAILNEFERAKAEVIADPRTAPLWVSKIQAYPAGFLKMCDDTIALSKSKVGEWLNSYMFKALPADERPGQRIANWLGDAEQHKTHGRPIGIEKAVEIGLPITKLEDDRVLQDRVLSVFHAVAITFEVTNCLKLVENHKGKGWFVNVEVQPKT